MGMSLQETLMVNSPIRDWFMRGEMAAFRRLADLPAGSAVLDMGCGRGTSVRLMLSALGGRPARLVAFDIDAAAVGQARRRLLRKSRKPARFWWIPAGTRALWPVP